MKKKLRKYIPRWVVTVLTNYHSKRVRKLNNGTLVIRPETTDLVVFRDVFILRYGAIRITPPVRCVIDAGAHAGYVTMYYAHKYPDALIIAIEPNEDNFSTLTANTEHLKNVVRIKAALWPTKETLYLHDRGSGHWGFVTKPIPAASNEQKLETVTIPDIIATYNLEMIDILKIDIEGSEKELFEGDTTAWLPRVRSISTETHDRFKPGCTAAVKKALPENEWVYSFRGDKHEFIRKS